MRRVLLRPVHVHLGSGIVVLGARARLGRISGRRHCGRQTDHARQHRARHAGWSHHQPQRTAVHDIHCTRALVHRLCGWHETDYGHQWSVDELDLLEVLSEAHEWHER